MNDYHHAIVWLDHSEAKVYRFGGDQDTEVDIHSHTSLQRLHHTGTGWQAGGNQPQDAEFFKRIVGALDHLGGTVITGPGNAKFALKAFIDNYRPSAATRVFAVETQDQPDADALLAVGREFLKDGPRVIS